MIRRAVRRDGEEGVVAVVVAVLAVVLLGFAALAIDVGALFWERAQLQSGADAGSLAVAQEIARGIADGESQPGDGTLGEPFFGTADRYADANAADGASDAEELEHEVLGPIAGEVTLGTLVNDAGDNELSHWFAGLIGQDSSTVRARASAIYGPLERVDGAFPVVVCEEDYQEPGHEGLIEIPIKGTGKGADPVETDCETEGDFPPGQTPGNFSWLATDGTACEFDFDVSGGNDTAEAEGDTGASVPSACRDDAQQIAEDIDAEGELPVRDIAVFRRADGTGSNTIYTITRITGFEFTGIKVVAQGNARAIQDSWQTPECSGQGMSKQCVQGRFVNTVGSGPVNPDADSDILGVQLTR